MVKSAKKFIFVSQSVGSPFGSPIAIGPDSNNIFRMISVNPRKIIYFLFLSSSLICDSQFLSAQSKFKRERTDGYIHLHNNETSYYYLDDQVDLVKVSSDSSSFLIFCYDYNNGSYIEAYDSTGNNYFASKVSFVALDLLNSSNNNTLAIGYLQDRNVDLKSLNGEGWQGANLNKEGSYKTIYLFDKRGRIQDSINTFHNYCNNILLKNNYILFYTLQVPFENGLYSFYIFDSGYNIIGQYSNKAAIILDKSSIPNYDPKRNSITIKLRKKILFQTEYPYSEIKIDFNLRKEELK